ncbi:hypothetical protein BDW74DRAFT_123400 [Aspergillus multicolor]|uniref:uncharacterized protein n=1 Tax=Aspergillus multicolor TaxID=41759 RepID=UPI003CCE0C14
MQPRTKGIHAFFKGVAAPGAPEEDAPCETGEAQVSWQVKKIGFDGERKKECREADRKKVIRDAAAAEGISGWWCGFLCRAKAKCENKILFSIFIILFD